MYILTQTINDECVFTSRETHNIKEVEHVLKVLASRDETIGEVDKSGQLVDIENKIVLWTPGERGLILEKENKKIEFKISLI